MKNKILPLAIFLILGISREIRSQDIIYKSDGAQIEGKVENVDSNSISYTSTKKSAKLQSLSTLQAALIVFQNGQYVTLPTTKEKVEAAQKAKNLENDIVITRYAEMIEGTIRSISKTEIEIVSSESNSVSKLKSDETILVVYRDGRHVLLKNAGEVKAILEYMHPQVAALIEKPASVTTTESAPNQPTGRPSHLGNQTSTTTTQTTPQQPAQQAVNTQQVVNSSPPANNSQTVTESNQQANSNAINSATSTSFQPTNTPVNNEKESSTSPNELSDIDFDEFSDKALQKIDDFTGYLSIISSKETFPESANQAIDLAVELFVNEDVIVEVSTVGYAESVKRKIRDYLTRLKLLKYDKVEIQWADINYVSNFRKAPDGNYYGTLTVKQTFRGYKDNQVVYSDVTQKDVEVVIKGMEKAVQGQKEMVWDVLLSDIGVLDTK